MAALALGADAINMGTRFMCTEEAPIHRSIKERIVEADERDTDLIFRTLRNTARVARNEVSRQVVEIEGRGDATFDDVRDLVAGTRGRKVFENGDPDYGVWSAGMCQALIHDIPTVAELVERIVGEADEIISGRLAGLIEPTGVAA